MPEKIARPALAASKGEPEDGGNDTEVRQPIAIRASTAARLRSLLQNSPLDLAELAKAISRDPGMVGRIFRAASSDEGEGETLENRIVLLGAERLQALAAEPPVVNEPW